MVTCLGVVFMGSVGDLWCQSVAKAPAIIVRYPVPSQLVSSDSNFLFGSVGNPKAKLQVNGIPVHVHQDGAFLAWMSVPETVHGDTAVYHFRASVGSDTVALDHVIRRPLVSRPLGSEPTWVDPRGLGERPERWTRPGEMVSFRFVAERGVMLQLIAGDLRISVPPLRHLRGTLDQYGVEIDLSLLRDAACEAGHCSRTVGSWPSSAPVSGLQLDTVKFELLASTMGYERHHVLKIPIAVLRKDAGTVKLIEAHDPTNGQSGVILARPSPFGPNRWRFPNGTTARVTGRFSDRFRIELTNGLEAWVVEEDTEWTDPYMGSAVTRDARFQLAALDLRSRPHLDDVHGVVSLRIGVSQPVPAVVSVIGERSVSLTLYNMVGQFDRIAHGVDTGVSAVTWTQMEGPTTRLEIEFDWPVWGYDLAYESGNASSYEGPRASRPFSDLPGSGEGLVLRLDLRPPPQIEKLNPLAGRRIAIDPGHPGAGSYGPTGLFEGDANLAVARTLFDLLKEAGAEPVLIRSNGLAMGLYRRTERAREAGAELFVSIHNNALPDGINPFEHAGTSTYYYHRHAVNLASYIQAGIVTRLGLKDLGVVWGDLAVVREPWMPSVLAEGAFMMVPQHEAALQTERFQTDYALGVMDGIEAYFADVGKMEGVERR